MLKGLSGRWVLILVTTFIGGIWLTPNFVNYDKSSLLGKTKIVPGLDIQGGLHLVMGVDVQTFIQEKVARQVKDLDQQMTTDGVAHGAVQIAGADKNKIEIHTGKPENKEAIVKFLNDRYSNLLQITTSEADKIELQYFEAAMIDLKRSVVNQAMEVIRNRIDEFGVAEPSITAQGSEHILIQLPGIKDATRAKELINRTAKLNFRIVSMDVPTEKLNSMIKEAETKGNYQLGKDSMLYAAYVKKLNEDLASQLPKNTKIVFEKNENAESLEAGRRPFLIKTDSSLGGEHLEDASVRPDQFGKPEVNFRFSVEGRRLFAELTGQAAGGLIAIVLDDVVKSAPSVKEQIDSDSARITLGNSRDFQAAQDEATFIATALRAGSLPAALEQLEERTVGPSLGGDSVQKAKLASMVGTLGVFLFMIFYYGVAGLIADIALLLNLVFTFAVLTSLGATLTLPGIAGIALTVGIAVDANVIIFERIKEELRKGASTVSAIRDGFSNAFSSIFDSNLTTVLTCLVLMYYGNGPIRGFAVTLTIGIVSSMFTAIFVSRAMLDTIVQKLNLKVLAQKPAVTN